MIETNSTLLKRGREREKKNMKKRMREERKRRKGRS